jgi:hypothetical protein
MRPCCFQRSSGVQAASVERANLPPIASSLQVSSPRRGTPWPGRARAVRVAAPMPAASNNGSGRRLPFAPLASMWTMWLLVSSWAPLVGLVMALADPPQERRTFLESIAANWGIGPCFLVRLGITYSAARKAFAARARWQAVAWLAAGGAALVVMLAGAAPVGRDLPESQQWEEWRELIAPPIALAAAWYGVLAAALYRPGGRSSHEQRDYGVALAGLWISVPVIASYFALPRVWLTDPAYPACSKLVRMTRTLFGHGDWFGTDFGLGSRGLGSWIHRGGNRDVLVGLQLVLASLLPVAVALGSLLRIIARRRWVHLVENGRIPGWGLMDATVQWPGGMPVLTGDGRGPVKVLARARDTACPYRAAEAEPVALVASSPGRGSRRHRRPAQAKLARIPV